MASWRIRFHDKWPHLASLYASTHQLDEDGKHPDPMMGQDNVFDPSEPYNAYRYYIQPVARSEFSIEEPPYLNRPVYKDEESRSSDYTSGDSFSRGSTCRVLLCVSLILSFIGVVVAAITLAVLLSQTPEPKKSALIQPEVYQSRASLLGRKFDEKLLDKDSDEFKKLAAEVCTALEQIFTDQDSPVRHEFAGCEVVEFKNGSVQAIFRIKLLPKSAEGFKNELRLIQRVQEHFATKIKEVGPWQSVKFNPEFVRRFRKVDLEPTTTTITNVTTTLVTKQQTPQEVTADTTKLTESTSAIPLEEKLTTKAMVITAVMDTIEQETATTTEHVVVDITDRAFTTKDTPVNATTAKIAVSPETETSTIADAVNIENVTSVTDIATDDTAVVKHTTIPPFPFDEYFIEMSTESRAATVTTTTINEQTSASVSPERSISATTESEQTSAMQQTGSGMLLTHEPYTSGNTGRFSTEGRTTTLHAPLTDKIVPSDARETLLATDHTDTHLISSTQSPDITTREVPVETTDRKMPIPSEGLDKTTQMLVDTTATVSHSKHIHVPAVITHKADTEITEVSTHPTSTTFIHPVTTDRLAAESTTMTPADIQESTTPSTVTGRSDLVKNTTEIPFDSYTDLFYINFTDYYQDETTMSPTDVDTSASNLTAASTKSAAVTDRYPTLTTTESDEFVLKNYTVVEKVRLVTSGPIHINVSLPERNVTHEALMHTTAGVADLAETQSSSASRLYKGSSTISPVDRSLSTAYSGISHSFTGDEATVKDYIYSTHSSDKTTLHTPLFKMPKTSSSSFTAASGVDETTPLFSEETSKESLQETTSEQPALVEYTTSYSKEMITYSDFPSTATATASQGTEVVFDQQTSHPTAVIHRMAPSSSTSVKTFLTSDKPQTSTGDPNSFDFSTSGEKFKTFTTREQLSEEATSLPSTVLETVSETQHKVKNITKMTETGTTTETTTMKIQTTLNIAVGTEGQIVPVNDTNATTGEVTEQPHQTLLATTPETREFAFLTERKERNITEDNFMAIKNITAFENVTDIDSETIPDKMSTQNETIAGEITTAMTNEALLADSTTGLKMQSESTIPSSTESLRRLSRTDSVPTSGSVRVDRTTSTKRLSGETTQTVNDSIATLSSETSTESIHYKSDITTDHMTKKTTVETVQGTRGFTKLSADYPQTTSVSMTNEASISTITTTTDTAEQRIATTTEVIPDSIGNVIDIQNLTDIIETEHTTESPNVTDKLETTTVTKSIPSTDKPQTTKATEKLISATAFETPVARESHSVTDSLETSYATKVFNVSDTFEKFSVTEGPYITNATETSNVTEGTYVTHTLETFKETEVPHLTESIDTLHVTQIPNMSDQPEAFNVTDALNATATTDVTDNLSVTGASYVTDSPNVTDRLEAYNMTDTMNVTDVVDLNHISETADFSRKLVGATTESSDKSLDVTMTGTASDIPMSTVDPLLRNVTDSARETTEIVTPQEVNLAATNKTNSAYTYETSTRAFKSLFNVTISPRQARNVTEYLDYENTTYFFDYNSTDFYEYYNFTDLGYTTDSAAHKPLVPATKDSLNFAKSNSTDSFNLTTTSGAEHLSRGSTTPLSVMNVTSSTESQGETSSSPSAVK